MPSSSRLTLLLLLALPLALCAQSLLPVETRAPALQLAGFKKDPNSTPAAPEPPAAPVPPPMPAVEHYAKLELKGIETRPLEIDARIWSDRDVKITKLPECYSGCQFTQHPAHGLTLYVKVTEAGTVVMGCSARWGTTADPEVAKDFMTAQKLADQGWVRRTLEEVETSSHDMQFLLFTKECKAGEELTIRTDKYAPPILLFK